MFREKSGHRRGFFRGHGGGGFDQFGHFSCRLIQTGQAATGFRCGENPVKKDTPGSEFRLMALAVPATTELEEPGPAASVAGRCPAEVDAFPGGIGVPRSRTIDFARREPGECEGLLPGRIRAEYEDFWGGAIHAFPHFRINAFSVASV